MESGGVSQEDEATHLPKGPLNTVPRRTRYFTETFTVRHHVSHQRRNMEGRTVQRAHFSEEILMTKRVSEL